MHLDHAQLNNAAFDGLVANVTHRSYTGVVHITRRGPGRYTAYDRLELPLHAPVREVAYDVVEAMVAALMRDAGYTLVPTTQVQLAVYEYRMDRVEMSA